MQIILNMHEEAVQYVLERTTKAKMSLEDYILELVREDWKKNVRNKKEEQK